ncbi:MAG: hypothetical protein D6B26_06770 [Spirochaetaceae bacterium]|nr:MAG: hypothetical protein D6B26_06770 [Spirochaetaceae bacterium]
MVEQNAFTEQLADGLHAFREELEKSDFTQLRDEFRMFYSAFEGLYKTFKKKGIIQDDPYRFEAKVTELEIPDETNFLENEREDKMSIRLSQFDAQLDYINNYFQFSLDQLTLERIKMLSRITQYIRWNELTDTNPNMNTQSVAVYANKLKHDGDNLSTAIVKDSQDQLAKYGKTIRARLKKITKYHREEYKLNVRQLVTDPLELQVCSDPVQEHLSQVKRRFISAMNGRPFYAELVNEVLNEDYGPDREQLQAQLLSELQPESKPKAKTKVGPSFEDMLKEGIRAMAQCSRSLELCINKLNDNHYLMENQKLSLGAKIQRWFAMKILKTKQDKTYEVEFMDPLTGTGKTERVHFQEFYELVQKKIKLYNGIIGKVGTVASRLDGAGEDQLFLFLQKNLEELMVIQRRMAGLDAFFKTEVPRDLRKQIRGIKNDLTALKNSLVNANQKRHDYVSKKEELEQLKRLGINQV